MKTILQSLKSIALMFALFLAVSQIQAQTRTATTSGNWNNTTTWGGASAPTSINDVIINSGVTVTVNVASAACNSITFSAGASGAGITISGSNSLTVTGSITMNGTTATGGTQPTLLTIGAGSVSCASLSLNPIASNFGSNSRRTEVTISTGSLSVSGDISCSGNISGAGGGTGITFSNSGSVSVGGSFMASPNLGDFTASTGTVNYSGATAQVIENYAYYNLTASGGGAKTLGGNRTITGNLLVDVNTVLSLGANNLTINANAARSATISGTLEVDGTGDLVESGSNTKTLIINSGGLVLLSSTSSTFPALNARTFNSGSTVEYSATGNQTVSNYSYSNLTLSGSGNKTVTGSTINGTLSMQGTAAATGTSPTYGGSAALEYRGSAAQNTSNVEFPTTVNVDLIINNASGVSLNGQKTLSGSLTLTNGVLTTTSTNLLIFPNNFSTVNGGSNTSYVNGPVRKNGSQAFTFPVGKNGLYSPISISAPDAAGDAFQAEYMRASGSALGGISDGAVFRVSNCEYWVLDEIADAGGTTSISVTVNWYTGSGCGGNGYITDISGVTLAHFNTGTSMWDTHGGTATGNPTTGTITRTGVNTFSPFTLGSTIDNANPLPVKFSGIKAFEKQSGIQLDWTAYQEENVDMYEVERSADGVLFVPIGTVDSRNSVTETKYGFFDAAPLPGVSFYRLRNVDIDGKSGYSNIVKVSLDKSVKSITIYPNPVRGEFISLQSSDLSKGNYTVRVVNSAGQQVYTQRFSHTGGAINETIQLPTGMQSGIYILQLDKEGTKVLAKAIVVQQ